MVRERLEHMLAALRLMREAERDPELRSAYNAACDRLDVLISRLCEVRGVDA